MFIHSHKITLKDWFECQSFNLLPHFLRAASFVSVSDEVEEERCRILEGGQHIIRKAESQKAKTFRIARFLSQKLSGYSALIATIFKFATNAYKRWFCKILCISMVQICSIDSAYNRCPKFGTFRIVRQFSRSPKHISKSSGLFLDYMDTFSRLSGHCLDRTETFQISHTLFRLSGRIF